MDLEDRKKEKESLFDKRKKERKKEKKERKKRIAGWMKERLVE